MSRDEQRVYLRLASDRVALDAPVLRLGGLARTALELAGARVLVSDEAGVPGKARDVASSWPRRHDRLLRDLTGGATPPGRARGLDLVVSDDVRTVARERPDGLAGFDGPVLWAGAASCLLDPPPTPSAALTLTGADARRLRAAGVVAVPLVDWPRPAGHPVTTPCRVVVAAAPGADHDVQAVVDALSAGLPGRPVIDVLPDVPTMVNGTRRAPMHPWMRSDLVRSCDLLLAAGRSPGTDLAAAEATLGGAAVWRLVAAAATAPSTALEQALPAHLALAPLDPDAEADTLHLPLAALAGWLSDASGASTRPGRKES